MHNLELRVFMGMHDLTSMTWQAFGNAQVTFYKFNCNKANKELGTKLEIKVAPTFILYKDGEEAKRLTGAKVEPLQAAIAELLT